MQTVEFRTRTNPATPWELCQVSFTRRFKTEVDNKLRLVKRIDMVAQNLADSEGQDVRWNFEGDTAGHVIPPASPLPKGV